MHTYIHILYGICNSLQILTPYFHHPKKNFPTGLSAASTFQQYIHCRKQQQQQEKLKLQAEASQRGESLARLIQLAHAQLRDTFAPGLSLEYARRTQRV